MKWRLYSYLIITLISILLSSLQSYGQLVNQEIIKAITTEDIVSLMKLYAPDAVLLPEYHVGLYTKKDIKRYYEERFRASVITDYTRTMHDYHQVEEYIIESGTFSYNYTLNDQAALPYSGKYIIVWKANKKHELKIISEIWGLDKYLERSSLSFPAASTKPYTLASDFKTKTESQKQIIERNTFIANGVKGRDGAKISTAYEANAIYMPYYSPMLIGNKKITEYYLKHEDPSVTIDSVQIKASRIIEVGNYALVDGYYGVKWRSGENSGTVTGKSINIWRRNKQGVYMLYRQMTNHD